MSNPTHLRYTKEHEWARLESDGSVTIGITDHAQAALGEVVYVDLPEIGALITAGQSIGAVESVKAASDVYSPLSGKVVAVNEALKASPEVVNQEPFGEGWFLKLLPENAADVDALLDAAAYDALIAE